MNSREPQSPEGGGESPLPALTVSMQPSPRRLGGGDHSADAGGGSSQSLEGRGWDGKLHHDSPQASIPARGGVGVVEEVGGEPLRASSSGGEGVE